MRSAVVAMSLVLCVHAEPAFAAPTSTCSGPEFRQLDFWLGDWNAAWAAPAGSPAGRGTNHITKSYGGCVIEEHFDGRPGQPLMGHSVSVYHAPSKSWRQTWVDNQGGYIDLQGGPDAKGDFVLVTLPNGQNKQASRMLYTDIKPDSFTWRWQNSADGTTWTDNWVITYTRMPR
jgi:hypothetical protein